MDMSVNFAGIQMKNPVCAASGTFGFGREYSLFFDLNKLGGVCVKGLTLERRMGNPPPRIAETPSGMLNSVGLQNPGVEEFLRKELPFLRRFNIAVIANAAGKTLDEYVELCKILSDADIDGIELNLSCPNVKEGGMSFGATYNAVFETTTAVKKVCKKPLIVKLTPNVTDIRETARAAEAAGADGISLINTLLGLAVNADTRRPILANNFGGLSGPAVKPVALRMVYEVYTAVKIPVFGMGGIMTGQDAVEFLLCGASAVMVGGASFLNPMACPEVIDGVEKYLQKYNVNSVGDLVGGLVLNG